MPPEIAAILYTIGIGGLFYLDREDSVRPSKALWLPVIWLLLNGSRPLSAWLGMNLPPEIPGQLPATSLLDRVVAAALMLSGIFVLICRRKEVLALLKANWPILIYFSFALVSLLWSDFPGWGFKRWIRAQGDLIMAMIIVSDAQKVVALRRLFSRVGFMLLPTSLLLIKYYPKIGRAFDAWGVPMNVGVTSSKNILGLLVYVIALGVLWQLLSLVHDKGQPGQRRRLVAQCTLLAFAIKLLFTAHSATSAACFILGAILMLIIIRPTFQRRPQALHVLILTILLVGGVALSFGGEADVVSAMGRNPNLSGRTQIWEFLIPMAPNPIGGAGFETFWVGPRVAALDRTMRMAGWIGGVKESHNGYIEVYLNLGLIGVGLIVLILGHGYFKTVDAFRSDKRLGALLIAYVFTAAFYNITEAGFRMLDLSWFFLILSVAIASWAIKPRETAPESGPELTGSNAVASVSTSLSSNNLDGWL